MTEVYEYVRMQAEILRVTGQAKFAVSFSRKSGAAWLFYATVDTYMKHLRLYQDAALEDMPGSAQWFHNFSDSLVNLKYWANLKCGKYP